MHSSPHKRTQRAVREMDLRSISMIVIASHNAGKVREIRDLVSRFDWAVNSSGELGLPEPDETETTFAGNARIKAHAAARASSMPCLADDSGLCVEALEGAPGVYTADWAETPSGRDFRIAMNTVWKNLEEANAAFPRRAFFNCTLCLADPDGSDVVFEGQVHGYLVWPPRGERGFGYDPMFVPDGYSETFGEMEPSLKHEISHRARAFDALVKAVSDA